MCEAADRVLGMRPYHVQIMGGAALHLGNIAEMKTGEGKTLVATMPSYLRALTGKGVHDRTASVRGAGTSRGTTPSTPAVRPPLLLRTRSHGSRTVGAYVTVHRRRSCEVFIHDRRLNNFGAYD